MAINANLASVSENKDHVDSTVGERWGGGGDDGEEEWRGEIQKGTVCLPPDVCSVHRQHPWTPLPPISIIPSHLLFQSLFPHNLPHKNRATVA